MSQIKIAKLDHDGVYWGLEDATLEQLAAGAVVFCARAALEPGEQLDDMDEPQPMPPAIVLPEGVVWAGEDCDLAHGAYVWNAKERRFDALPPKQRKVAQGAPDLARALFDYWSSRPWAELPESVRAWVLWMRVTVDELGRK